MAIGSCLLYTSGKYSSLKGSKENYLIQLISRAKYLESEVTEPEMVNKLAHHFGRGIQIALITQGVKTLEELPLLLTKWDNVDSQSGNNNNNKQFQPQQQKQRQFKNKPVFQIFNQCNVCLLYTSRCV